MKENTWASWRISLVGVALGFAGCTGNMSGTEPRADAGDGGTGEDVVADGGSVFDAGPDGGANTAPVAAFSATPGEGAAPLSVTFEASASTDDDGTIVSYEGDLAGSPATGATTDRTFTVGGCHEVTLTITDNGGATDTATSMVVVSAGSVLDAEVNVASAPLPNAILPRDVATDLGSARFSGTVGTAGTGRLTAVVESGGEEISRSFTPLCGEAPCTFDLDVPISSELRSFDVRIFLERSGESEMVHETTWEPNTPT